MRGHQALDKAGIGESGRNCNIVAWNPKNKYVFASGGDDGYMVIWKIVKSQDQ